MAKIRLKDATIRLIAPNSAANGAQGAFSIPAALGNFTRCDLKIGDGTLSWTENRAVEYVLDRGAIFHATDPTGLITAYTRFGDETPMEVSFDFIFDSYAVFGDTSSVVAPYGPIELLKGENALAGAARKPFLKPTTATPYSVDSVLTDLGYTTFSDGVVPLEDYQDFCAPYCLDVLASFEKTCAGSSTAEHYLFKYFRFTSLDYDLSAGQISVSGQCQRALAKHFSQA
jgi:hypothetical protein